MAQEKITIKFEPKDHDKLIKALNNLAKAQNSLEKGIKGTNSASKKYGKTQEKLNKTTIAGVNHQRLLGGAFATLRSKLLLATFAMTMFIKPFIRMMQESAKVKALTTAFDTLTGSTEGAVTSLNKLREATDNTMTSTDLLQQANNALILGVAKNSDEMAEMFDVAQRLGRALGRDTASSVESLITGIGRQSRLMLDNIGIIVKAEEAYDAYAEKLGISTDRLTDAQRKTAFFEATMESAREKVSRLGAEMLTTQDVMNQAGASFDNLKIAIGDKLNPVFIGVTKSTANAADSMAKFIRELDLGTVNDMTNKLSDLGATMKQISLAEAIRSIPDMFENLSKVQKEIANFTKEIDVTGWEAANDAMKEYVGGLVTTFNKSKTLEGRTKALNQAQDDLANSQKNSIVWMTKQEQHKAGIIKLSQNEQGELIRQLSIEEKRQDLLNTLIPLFKDDLRIQQALVLSNKLVSKGINERNIVEMDAIVVAGDFNKRQKEKIELARQEIELARQEMDTTLAQIAIEDEAIRQIQKEAIASKAAYDIMRSRIEIQKKLNAVMKPDRPELGGGNLNEIKKQLETELGIRTDAENNKEALLKLASEKSVAHYTEMANQILGSQMSQEEKSRALQAAQQVARNSYLEDELAIIKSHEEEKVKIINKSNMDIFQAEQANIVARIRIWSRGMSAIASILSVNEKNAKHVAKIQAIAAGVDAFGAAQKAWAEAQKHPLNLVTSGGYSAAIYATTLATGLAQAIATHKAADKMEQGGLIGGRRHSQGGTMIEAEQGEFIMSRSAVESLGIENLNRMNQGGGGAVTVNVSGNVLSQDFVEGELAENIKEAVRRGTDFGIS